MVRRSASFKFEHIIVDGASRKGLEGLGHIGLSVTHCLRGQEKLLLDYDFAVTEQLDQGGLLDNTCNSVI